MSYNNENSNPNIPGSSTPFCSKKSIKKVVHSHWNPRTVTKIRKLTSQLRQKLQQNCDKKTCQKQSCHKSSMPRVDCLTKQNPKKQQVYTDQIAISAPPGFLNLLRPRALEQGDSDQEHCYIATQYMREQLFVEAMGARGKGQRGG